MLVGTIRTAEQTTTDDERLGKSLWLRRVNFKRKSMLLSMKRALYKTSTVCINIRIAMRSMLLYLALQEKREETIRDRKRTEKEKKRKA